jgi:PAS domain S-box-containing protein
VVQGWLARVPLGRRSLATGVLIALACVAIATAVRLAAQPLLASDLPFLTYFPAILVAACLGGRTSGFIALVASAVLSLWLFVSPHGQWTLSPPAAVAEALFLLAGGMIVLVGSGLVEALRLRARSEHRFRSLAEATSHIVVRIGPEGQSLERNPAFRAYTGMGEGESGPLAWLKMIHSDDLERFAFLTREQAAQRRPVSVEFRLRHAASGEHRWVRGSAVPVVEADGEVREWVGAIEDIHDRRMADEQMRTVARELEHRVKNVFALMQALVRQSARSAESVEHYREALEARLSALAQAQSLITAEPGAGAVSLPDLVRTALGPFDLDRNAGCATGPDVSVPAQVAVPLALMLHELGTNAAKYGALSGAGGRVNLTWEVLEGRVRMDWQERDGPPVIPPQSQGFGAKLIASALSGHGGAAELSYEPDGIRCRIELPAAEAG